MLRVELKPTVDAHVHYLEFVDNFSMTEALGKLCSRVRL